MLLAQALPWSTLLFPILERRFEALEIRAKLLGVDFEVKELTLGGVEVVLEIVPITVSSIFRIERHESRRHLMRKAEAPKLTRCLESICSAVQYSPAEGAE